MSGLDGNGTVARLQNGIHVDHHRCTAFKAGKRLSHLELVDGTW